jgi:hypothetical protein
MRRRRGPFPKRKKRNLGGAAFCIPASPENRLRQARRTVSNTATLHGIKHKYFKFPASLLIYRQLMQKKPRRLFCHAIEPNVGLLRLTLTYSDLLQPALTSSDKPDREDHIEQAVACLISFNSRSFFEVQ